MKLQEVTITANTLNIGKLTENHLMTKTHNVYLLTYLLTYLMCTPFAMLRIQPSDLFDDLT